MIALSRYDSVPTEDAAARPSRVPDDVAMLRKAAELTRDINVARPAVYWGDFLGSAVLGYAGLAGAILLSGAFALVSALIAILALYRAGSFIHELTHVRHRELPWFRLAGTRLLVSRCWCRVSCMKACTICIIIARDMARSRIPNICHLR